MAVLFLPSTPHTGCFLFGRARQLSNKRIIQTWCELTDLALGQLCAQGQRLQKTEWVTMERMRSPTSINSQTQTQEIRWLRTWLATELFSLCCMEKQWWEKYDSWLDRSDLFVCKGSKRYWTDLILKSLKLFIHSYMVLLSFDKQKNKQQSFFTVATEGYVPGSGASR